MAASNGVWVRMVADRSSHRGCAAVVGSTGRRNGRSNVAARPLLAALGGCRVSKIGGGGLGFLPLWRPAIGARLGC